jgi:hypothetical protein
VTGFDTSKITVVGGTKGAFSGSGAVYTQVVTPEANSTTAIGLTTSTTGVTDAAGNVVTAPAVYTQAVDTLAPAVSLANTAAGAVVNAVESTHAAGVTSVTAESGSAWTVTFTGQSGNVTKTGTGTGSAQAVILNAGDVTTLGQGAVTVSVTATDAAGNPATASTGGNFSIDTLAPTNNFEKGIYSATSDTFTLVGTNMLSITGATGAVDKNLFDWSKFDINLGDGQTFNSITASDIESVTLDSGSRLSIKLTTNMATTLESNAQWSLAGTATTDVLSVQAGFTRDAAGNVATTDGNATIRFNNINLGTHQGGTDTGTWSGNNSGSLINAVLVDDNRIFYAWDVNNNGGHGVGDMIELSGTSGLAAFMGKGASSNVTEDVASRSFSLNGINLRLPTDGNPASVNHVDPANLVSGTNFADARDIYIPGNPVNALGTLHAGWYVAQGTANTAQQLHGDTSENPAYDDLLAIWDAFNGSGQGNSVYNGSAWLSLNAGAPSDWGTLSRYWSATPSASGHAIVGLDAGVLFDNSDISTRYVAFEVL